MTTPIKCVTKLSHRSSSTKVDEGEGEEWVDEEAQGGAAGGGGTKRKRDDIEPILESHGQQVRLASLVSVGCPAAGSCDRLLTCGTIPWARQRARQSAIVLASPLTVISATPRPSRPGKFSVLASAHRSCSSYNERTSRS